MPGRLKPLDVERETKPGKYADGDTQIQKLDDRGVPARS